MTTQTFDRNSATSKRLGLKYLLIGGGIGAAAALLLAPKRGAEIRHEISDATRRGYGGTLDLARRFKEQSTGIYNTLADKVGKATGISDAVSGVATPDRTSVRSSDGSEADPYQNLRARPRESARRSSTII